MRRDCFDRAASSAAAVALVVVVLGCAWNRPRPYSSDEVRALEIAGQVYGINLLPAEPPRLSIHYAPPTCTAADGGPGYVTRKGRCVSGSLAYWTPHINIAGQAGMRLSSTPGFCLGTWEVWELANEHAPNELGPGEVEKVAECRRRLREAGL